MLLSLLCISCSTTKKASYDPFQKYSATQLREDFTVLENVLKSNHPSLYWYSSKATIDSYFNATAALLNDSLTEQQFKNKVSWAVSKINCGHTTVRSSKQAADYFSGKKLPQFPLMVKVWDDSAVVIVNMLPTDSVIKRGTVITSINGKGIRPILDSIFQLIGTDGYSNNFKYQVVSFNFPAFYRNSFGTDSQYLIKYIDTFGEEKERVIKNYVPENDTMKNPGFLPGGIPRKELRKLKLERRRNLVIDTSLNTAFLSVNTFSEGKLVRFFVRSFRKIHQQNIKNVVLDLRLNTGGSVLACAKLSQYLRDKPFRIADTIAAYSRTFPYKKHIKPWFLYWLSMHLSGRQYDDGRIHFRYFEKHYYKPKKKNHFNGKIYVLTGGYTFSAATLVTGNLKGQKNVTVVGEETGGGAYGNSAMFLTNIILPNTGIRVTLPLYRMVLNADLPKNGRGVLPDVEVKPSSVYIKEGIDVKLEKVKDLIKKNKSVVISAE